METTQKFIPTVKRFYLLAVLSLSTYCHLFGQSNFLLPKVPIPDEAKITRFQDYPMDYCTGLPDITIPLYEVQVGDIVLPITLKYHAAGFRPCENYSNVGLGWSIFAEPSFTQNVRGGLDGHVNTSSFSEDGATLKKAWNRKIDEQSDLYRYRLLNSSGILLWKQPYSFVSFPYEPLDVSRSGSGNDITISINDADGVYYFFKGLKEYDRSYNDTSGNLSYMCTSISSNKNTNNKISFEYNFPTNQYYYVSREEFLVERKEISGDEFFSASIRNASFGQLFKLKRENDISRWVEDYDSQQPQPLNNLKNMKVRSLRKIETRNEVVILGYTNILLKDPYEDDVYYNQSVLYNIEVRRKPDNRLIRNISLDYGTFANFYPKLRSIKIYLGDNKETQIYQFEYEDKSVPPYFSNDMRRIDQYVDDFGFYNSQMGSTPDFYSIKLDTKTYGTIYATANPFVKAVKNSPPNPYTKYCTNDAMLFTLTEIKLPTGGSIKYAYEGNEVVSNFGESTFAGLRVRKITKSDSGKHLQRKFEYGDSIRKSYGRLFREKQDFYYYTNHVNGYNYEIRSIYRNPLIPLGYNKAPILYDQVDEYVHDGNGGYPIKIQRGYINEFAFQPAQYSNTPDVNPGFIPPSDFLDQYKYGLLYDEIHYNKKTDQYVPVKEIKYDYDLNVPQTNNSTSVQDRQVYRKFAEWDIRNKPIEEGADTTYQAYSWMGFNLRSSCLKPISKITVLYNPNGDTLSCHSEKYHYGTAHPYAILTEKESVYPSFPEEEFSQSSTNSAPVGTVRSVQQSLYPNNFWYHPLTTIHCLSTPVQVTDSVNGKFVSRTIDEYKSGNRVVKSKVKTYFDPLLQDSTVGYYDAYDSWGNVLEAHKGGYPKTVFHWGYNNRYMVARIENYTLAQLNANTELLAALNRLQKFDTEFYDATSRTELQALNQSIRTLVPADAKIATYTYIPTIGMTSQTTPNGQTTYYEYDGWLQLKTIRNHRYEIEKSYWMNIRK